MERYYDKLITDLCPGITFKYKRLNPVEHIALATRNIEAERSNKSASTNSADLLEQHIKKCLTNILFTKDERTYRPIVNDNGVANFDELNDSPSLALDLYYAYKTDVIQPVFYESKTFQNLLMGQQEKVNN